MRNKGKVHPLIASSSSSSYSASKEVSSVLKLLPAVILALISVLSFEDREVLAYMINRSLKLTNTPVFSAGEKKIKKSPANGHGHKPPASFDCECFDCYTSFWSRWDSSPNRELIHQAIEAFEEHLNTGEQSRKSNNGKNRKKEKLGRRKSEKIANGVGVHDFPATEGKSERVVSLLPVSETEVSAPKEDDEVAESEESEVKDVVVPKEEEEVVASPPSTAVDRSHKGLARKVLPDVLGLFNSRLWGLWNPNV
ncbi:uncharacterized protein LOC111375926 [Olea europaea var. sylvestris]|uniref:uncharacterized protein LOC111375926 n=1 Tax=Olea europaea var. sylvestris TaxID=158386 RepID=UPI000C1D5CAB|nr:uncharacterized protein LOC111375926 [Olea europaea var. sylvestris]